MTNLINHIVENITQMGRNIISLVSEKNIAFADKDKKFRAELTSGNTGLYNALTGVVLKELATETNFLSWKTGQLVFKESSLGAVCHDLSTYYNLSVKIAPSLINKPVLFTGTFDHVSVQEALRIINATLDIKSVSVKDTIILQ